METVDKYTLVPFHKEKDYEPMKRQHIDAVVKIASSLTKARAFDDKFKMVSPKGQQSVDIIPLISYATSAGGYSGSNTDVEMFLSLLSKSDVNEKDILNKGFRQQYVMKKKTENAVTKSKTKWISLH